MKSGTHIFHTLIVFLLIFLSLNINALVVFRTGAPAPDIHISKWLNYNPSEKNIFKGKTIVLEFWATWCRPCINSIPHINQLVEQFACDSVMFISISKEQTETLCCN